MRSQVLTTAIVLLSMGVAGSTHAVAAQAENAQAAAGPQALAKKILATAGVRGGLVVHLGCGDGELTAALRGSEALLVQGLDVDAASIAQARQSLADRGLSASVSLAGFDGERLPYADNTVNLLVIQRQGKVPQSEIERVLCPYGVACAVRGGECKIVLTKLWPREMDEWSHFLHAADNNAVAKDTLVGPPYHLQWEAGPRFSKSHDILPSVQCVVSAGGRLLSIADEGPIPLPHALPPRWMLVARDAFNGTLLWQRPFATWQPMNTPNRHLFPTDLYRRLVADRDRVYVTLDIFGPLTALDAATGQTQMTYKDTAGVQEIILKDGVLYLVLPAADPKSIDRRQLGTELLKPEPKRVLAMRAATGEVLWSKGDGDTLGLLALTLATDGKRLFFQTHKAIHCLDIASGATRWQFALAAPYPRPGWSAPTLVVQGDVVLSADQSGTAGKKGKGGGQLVALSAQTGKRLWESQAAQGVNSPVDVFAVDDLLWLGEKKARSAQDFMRGRTLATGQVVREMPPTEDWPNEHHHRCYRDKATLQYILAGRQGVEFLDLKSGEILPHPWIRGSCRHGIVPCNGLLYVTPHECGCYLESKLNGFFALAPKGAAPASLSKEQRLQRGPAYGQEVVSGQRSVASGKAPAGSARNGAKSSGLAVSSPPSPLPLPPPYDWPTYRHDNARSGYVHTAAPLDLGKAWSVALGGTLTPPVCAGGRLFVAQKDRATLVCLDANGGKPLWRFVAGGGLDSPPTIAGDLVVFGAHDGWVYALRAADGRLAWRYRVAPGDRWLVCSNRLESAWPVCGSVLVENGVIYCAAGRTSYLDGGMYLCKLDLTSGRCLQERNFYSRDPKTGRPVKLYESPYRDMLPGRELPGLLQDILSADETNLYLRGVAFSRDLKIQQEKNRPHIFSSMGLLDDNWWERSYWIYGEHFYSGLASTFYAAYRSPAGKLLVTDDQNVYGYWDPDLAANTKRGVAGLMATSKLPALVESKMLAKKAEKSGRYRNAKPSEVAYHWSQATPLYGWAMLATDDALYVAGPKRFDETVTERYLSRCPTNTCDLPPLLRDAVAAFAGEKGSLVWAVSKQDGKKLAEFTIESKPVFDGLIAAEGRLYVCTTDGNVHCLAQRQ